jgi:hypothetical protein
LSGAAIFHKEVCEAVRDIPTLERFEYAKDDVEIAWPAPTHAGDKFGVHTGRVPVLAPYRILRAKADDDGDAKEGEGQTEA